MATQIVGYLLCFLLLRYPLLETDAGGIDFPTPEMTAGLTMLYCGEHVTPPSK
jgi:hypothetical protein